MCLLTNFMIAQEAEVSFLGALLPEFNVKIGKYTPVDSLRSGIELNQQFKEQRLQSTAFQNAVKLVRVRDKRVCVALTEIIFDHFLAFHWEKFNEIPLADFSEMIYKKLESQKDLLPQRIKNEFHTLFNEKTFSQYATLRGTSETIKTLSRHYPQNTAIGIELLLSDLYEEYNNLKELFFDYIEEVNLMPVVKA